MERRWWVLALLFTVRVSMAFQFQAVATLSPLLMDRFGVGLADIGILIGLYLAPGIVIAVPGGSLGKRFGDFRIVAAGLALMVVGGAVVLTVSSWEGQIVGRTVAGVGGVLLNVLMSKMVTDWFAGRELGTAMGIFVNSWPVGIALALLVLPFVAEGGGLDLAFWVVGGVAAAGLLLFVTGYRARPAEDESTGTGGILAGAPLIGVIVAGAVWGLYNAAIGMIFGFGPAMLSERGWSLTAASSTTSMVIWLVAISVPFGGFVADRVGQRDSFLQFGLLGFAAVIGWAAFATDEVTAFIILGLFAGLAAGPVMSLPAAVLAPANRAYGMGVFFTLFYVGVVGAPIVAGWLADIFGTARAAFLLGTVMLVAASLAVPLFRRVASMPALERVPQT